MASFVRLARQGCRIISANRSCLQAKLPLRQNACFISTSKKNKDSAAVSTDIQAPVKSESESLLEKEQNWISFGYSLTDRDEDEWSHHMIMFFGITICLCGSVFYISYHPDLKMHDWIQREAYLELARREKEGLPLIDANLINPSKIDLPSDEELGDTEIII